MPRMWWQLCDLEDKSDSAEDGYGKGWKEPECPVVSLSQQIKPRTAYLKLTDMENNQMSSLIKISSDGLSVVCSPSHS